MASQKTFWNKEYESSKNFSLSDRPAEDLLKFTRYLERASGRQFLNPTINILDLGSGNGRNLIYLAKTYGCRGTGYDISEVAIKQAKQATQTLVEISPREKSLRSDSLPKPLNFEARSIAGKFDLADNSFDIVLDMMTSHYLVAEERAALVSEIFRLLKPGGWLFYKTFLLDNDRNAKRMLQENPAAEPNSYIHPTIGFMEHVSNEEEIRSLYEPRFEIEKIEKSGKHILHGKAGKRRSIIVYMRKSF